MLPNSSHPKKPNILKLAFQSWLLGILIYIVAAFIFILAHWSEDISEGSIKITHLIEISLIFLKLNAFSAVMMFFNLLYFRLLKKRKLHILLESSISLLCTLIIATIFGYIHSWLLFIFDKSLDQSYEGIRNSILISSVLPIALTNTIGILLIRKRAKLLYTDDQKIINEEY